MLRSARRRTPALGALMLGGISALGVAGQATALPVVDILWTGTTGAGATGGPTITAAPGDTITATIFVTLMAGDLVSGYGISLEFDRDLGNELDFVSATEFLPLGFLFNATVGVGPPAPVESTGAGMGSVFTYEALAFAAVPTPAVFAIGTVEFMVTANVATDGDDVFSGVFNLGIDASPGGLPTTFNNAGVDAASVPEPSSLGLLTAGLGLLGLAFGRLRR